MIKSETYSPIQTKAQDKDPSSGLFLVLPFIALAIDLLTPFLIWKGILPSSVRWISHASIAIIIVLCFLRMLAFDNFPRIVLLITAISLVWIAVAVFQGQRIIETLWGWWLFFQFPFVGLFIYLQPCNHEFSTRVIRKFALISLAIEVVVQCIQYLLDEKIGDNLAGTFGRNGTGNLILFILLIDCLFLGNWITTKQWKSLVLALALSLISSILGEMKLFIIGLPILCVLALVFYSFRNKTIIKSTKYGLIFVSVLVAFFYLYNTVIPGARRSPLQKFVTDPQFLIQYLDREEKSYKNGYLVTNLGRNRALAIGWDSLRVDPVTLLFGWGIGSRSESVTLGTAGRGIQSGNIGNTSGTGLLIMMQEMGIVGLATIFGFFIWIIFRLRRDIKKDPLSDVIDFRYGLILFTILMPIWLWYNNSWNLRVPMLLYWGILGYAFAQANQFPGLKVSRLDDNDLVENKQ